MAAGDSGRSVLSWTISDVRAWLTELGMARYAKVFCDQHRVDGPTLLMIQVKQSVIEGPMIEGECCYRSRISDSLRCNWRCWVTSSA